MATCSRQRREALLCRLRRFEDAVDCWDVDPDAVALLWDFWVRYNLHSDVIVVGHTQPFAEAAERKLEKMDVPVRKVTVMPSAQHLGRRLVRMPDVLWVVYSDPRYLFTFGSRGRPLHHG